MICPSSVAQLLCVSSTTVYMIRGVTREPLIIGASMRTGIGIIFGLFIICFIFITLEELFFGGRKRRRAERLRKERDHAHHTDR